MNWGRGLFRVWLVLSGLWLAPCAAIIIADGQLFAPRMTYKVKGPALGIYEVSAPKSASELEVVNFVAGHQSPDCSDGKTGPGCSYPIKLEMPGKPIDPTPIILAIGVPIGALLIGGGIYWALLGFRRNPQT